MRNKQIGLMAAGLVLVSSVLVVGQSKQPSRIKAHGLLPTTTNRYQVSITTNEGKVVFVQPPHTRFYYEAWSVHALSDRKHLVRSFGCAGDATFVMTQYGKRILSMKVDKATVEVADLPG